VLTLRVKLDATGFYDDFEVNRVVEVELNSNSKQGQLQAAMEPVAQRLLTQFKNAKAARKAAIEAKDDKAAQAAKDQMDALVLFRSDMVTYERAYTFLSPYRHNE